MSWLRYLLAWWQGFAVEVFERADDRLGRHQIHNPKAWLYDARTIVRFDRAPTEHVRHERHAPVWQQGEIGMCTAAAALGVLSSGPFWETGTLPIPPKSPPNGLPRFKGQQSIAPYVIADALQLYREETRLDDSIIEGHYEPTDTGSTGDWSMAALRDRGLITGWVHAFRFADLVRLLARQPVSIGVCWYEGFFTPDARGYLHATGQVAGGHQVCVDELIPVKRPDGRITDYDFGITNSWGPEYGVAGRCFVSGPTMRRLLAEGGDVVSPRLR